MSTPFQFGRSYRERWFIGLIVAAAALSAAGAVLLIVRPAAAYWVLLAAAVTGFSAVMSVVLIARSRFQLEILPHGFVLRDRHGEREFDDEQLICAGLSFRPNYTNGVLKSTTRTLDVWVESAGGSEQIALGTRLAIGASDPLAPFIERVQGHLYERARGALDRGEAFEGEGWTLLNSELIVRTPHDSRTARLDDLAAVDVFDDCLCVWKLSQDEPVLRIPVSSANTRVLQRLLGERVARRAAEPAAGDGLGRILFERKPDRSVFLMAWFLPILIILTASVVIALALRVAGQIAVIGLPVCGLLLLLWLAGLFVAVEFQVCERGVRHKWLHRIQQLKYADVESFTYSAMRQYVKGTYAGTHFALTFASQEGGKRKKLTYSRTLRNVDAELDHLRDHVSSLIANRMMEEFAENEAVVWTEGLRFLAKGLEYRAAGILGRKAPILIPYADIYGYDADLGIFSLWVHGQKKPAARENVNQPNFFPGYHALARILADRTAGVEAVAAR